MKRLTAWLLAALLVSTLLTGCGRKKTVLLEQPENLYVADCADVLSESTETYVVARTTALKEACGGEIVIVTLDYLNGLTAEEYAYTVFNQWGIGDRTKNNGMLVLLVIGENSCWLTPGYGIEADLPSTQCTELLRQYLWEHQNAGDCDTGVRNLVDALTSWYCSYYGISISGVYNNASDFVIETESDADGLLSGSGILTLLAIGFVIFLLIQNAERRSGYRRKRSYFIPMMFMNSLFNNQGGGSYHSSSGSSSHSGHSGGFGGGGSHGGGGGFRG